MSETHPRELSDRDLLVRIDTKVDGLMQQVPALDARVKVLEEGAAELRGQAKALKGLTYIGGGGGIAGFL